MSSSSRLTLAVLCLALAQTARGQAPSYEYRPQLILSLPDWHGAGLSLVEEQHLQTSQLEPVERQHGVVLALPGWGANALSVDMRHVVSGAGLVEHRYAPALTTSRPLHASGAVLRNRLRVELRDINGIWSQRYQERVTIERPVVMLGQPVQPYGYGNLSYDTRFSTFARREGGFGVRVPLADGTSLDPFVMRETDTRRAIPTTVAMGLTLRVAL